MADPVITTFELLVLLCGVFRSESEVQCFDSQDHVSVKQQLLK